MRTQSFSRCAAFWHANHKPCHENGRGQARPFLGGVTIIDSAMHGAVKR